MTKNYKLYLAGKWVDRKEKFDVINPWDDKVVAKVAAASSKDFTKAIDSAEKMFAVTRTLPSHKRESICKQIASLLEKDIEKFTKMMSFELGKSYKDSKGEVKRAIGVFTIAGEEAKRVGGEIMDLDWAEGAENRIGLIRRFPKGVIAGISPFNFPLNLIAHKVAPAIAVGNPIIIKPATKTPIMALMLAELIDKTDYPKGAISILPASPKESQPLIDDPRVKLITFTGSSEVGWMIREKAAHKEVVLELGGNAGVAIADDAEIDYAVERVAHGSFAVAGQSCISVQRVFVHEDIYDQFKKKLKARVNKIKVGNPIDPDTDMGMMVDKNAAKETMEAIKAALDGGAKIVTGGKMLFEGRTLAPTVLENVKNSMDVCSKEAFAPLAVLMPYKDYSKMLDEINNSEYGLQAGIFTNRIKDIWTAFERIECGGIVINDVPTFRADQQPYGGMKKSGLGREGIRWGIEDQTDVKILSMNLK